MKKWLIGSVVCCIAHFSSGQELAAKLDTLVSAYTRIHKFNGAVLVTQHNTVLLNKGYGYQNVADKIANNANTVFQLGSITKQFTTAVILKLQEEKKLNVQDKISKYFPKYPKGDSITIEQLMLHTSGIHNYTNDRKFMETEVSKPANREKMMALFQNKPLDFSPGTAWNYSNSGYLLLGYIIEKVTKKPWDQAIRKYIFNPLQMTHSGFDFTHLDIPEKALGYFKLDDQTATIAPIVDSSVSFSAGAIYSTTGDLYKWHKALEDYTILSKAQQEKAYTPVKNNYGYGWSIDSIEGKRKVGHSGGIHGFTTNFARVPEDDICIVLLDNASHNTLYEITNKILNAIYSKPYELPKQRAEIKIPEETLKQYEGEYEIRPDLHVIMNVKDGQLTATPTNQRTNLLYAEKEDFFFVKDENIQIEFLRNYKKDVDGFILHQNGGKMSCRKIFHNPSNDNDTLYSVIAHMDSVLFNAFNGRDLETIKKVFDKDIEFYHDKTGLTRYEKNMQAFTETFAGERKVRRELVKGSLEVYPSPGYGAIQAGSHRFYVTEPGQEEKLSGTFKFVHVWKNDNGQWTVTRIVSYDH